MNYLKFFYYFLKKIIKLEIKKPYLELKQVFWYSILKR